MVEEVDLLTVGEEAEAVVVVLGEEDEDDQITTITTAIRTVGRIHNSITTTISLSSSNRQYRNSKANPVILLRTSLIEGRE